MATNGDDTGVHQARVASRRLREAVPVLTPGVKGTKAKKARGKIRRLTQALGTVRELDVTLQLLDELAPRDTLPRTPSRTCAPTWSPSATGAAPSC